MRNLFFKSLPAIFLLLFFLSNTALGQSPTERQQKIRAQVEQGDTTGAIQSLQEFRTVDPTLFALNNYDYLLARLSERRGDTGAAQTNYRAIIARRSILAQYALWHLAQLARTTGNLVLERQHLSQLTMLAPTSLLREAVQHRLAESFYESGDFASAISMLKPRAAPGGNPSAREALALIGQAYMRSGQKEAAREIFNQLITQLPVASEPDDFALAAVRGLDALDGGSEQNAPQLSESEHMRRAFIYHFNRDFAGARRHYAALVEHYPQSALLADALYQTGRSLFQEGHYEESLPYFQRVTNQFPQSVSARDALSSQASAYARLKRTDEAVATLKRFIELYADAPNPERNYLNIVDLLRDAGRDDEALQWIGQTRAKFKGQLGEALAIFSAAKLHIARNEWAAAITDLNELSTQRDLGGVRVPGGTSLTEIAFLKAFALEQSGRFEEAIDGYLAIPDGRNEYYGGRATVRLRALNLNERARAALLSRLENFRREARDSISANQAENARRAAQSALRLTEDASITSEMLDIARRAYSVLPSYRLKISASLLPAGRTNLIMSDSAGVIRNPTRAALADELLFLGLYDEGTPELASAWRTIRYGNEVQQAGSPNSPTASDENIQTRNNQSRTPPRSMTTPDQAYTLAVFYKRGDDAFRAIAYAEPLWKRVPNDFLLELAPREAVELLYPAPYRDALLAAAPQRGVDPRFILSIARQESRFRPDIKSAAAARGLLQFIPSTASNIAEQLNFKNFQQDDLYDPRISILFGAQYMGNLFRQFPQMPQAVAASYNGGEDNVSRWVARARSDDADRYVAEIGFTQSKDYIYKVLSSYRVYQSLYTEQLQRR
ncbi:MAG TPA: transglycosylase SLT domain-containing protein [Pyrinomonadaceae bacterium]|nr:transglycosylase SLT domain-containing protein [Pyrinomonadaceae bacterium]